MKVVRNGHQKGTTLSAASRCRKLRFCDSGFCSRDGPDGRGSRRGRGADWLDYDVAAVVRSVCAASALKEAGQLGRRGSSCSSKVHGLEAPTGGRRSREPCAAYASTAYASTTHAVARIPAGRFCAAACVGTLRCRRKRSHHTTAPAVGWWGLVRVSPLPNPSRLTPPA